MKYSLLAFLATAVLLLDLSTATHFRGASAYYHPLDTTGNVRVSFFFAWRHSSSEGKCPANETGAIRGEERRWACDSLDDSGSGCPGKRIGTMQYKCREPFVGGATSVDNWSAGDNSFDYQFNLDEAGGRTTFVISPEVPCCWIAFQNFDGAEISLQLVINLKQRPDTMEINRSPQVTVLQPVITVFANCRLRYDISPFDDDGDRIRCRWARQNVSRVDNPECGGVCGALEAVGAVLDEEQCVITWGTTNSPIPLPVGRHPAALVIEDFADFNNGMEPLSSVPLQFIVQVEPASECSLPTVEPVSGRCIGIPPGESFAETITARPASNLAGNEIVSIRFSSTPDGLNVGPLTMAEMNVWEVSLAWTPLPSQYDLQQICYRAIDKNGLESLQQCIRLFAGVSTPSITNDFSMVGFLNHGDKLVVEFSGPVQQPVVDRYIRIIDIGSNEVVLMINTRTSSRIEVMTTTASNATIDVGTLCADRNYTVEIEDGAFVGLENCGGSGPEVDGIPRDQWIFVAEGDPNFDPCSDPSIRNCHSNAVCMNSCPGVICQCKSGFEGNGTFCVDINECTRNEDDCDVPERATCTNTDGSFTCACRAGYTGDGKSCVDVDECLAGSDDCDVDSRATCTNTVGSFTCACKTGYSGDGKTCADIDECALDADDCDADERATCTNTIGSFTCACKIGYAGDGKSCSDVNECLLDTDDCDVDSRATCTNTVGSFTCACKTGYSGDGKTCTDIDECALDADDCDADERATCTNTIGSFTCACKGGYTGDGKTCTDVDECTLMTDDCDDPVRAVCTNTIGSFTCACREGYSGDGKSCVDIDECTLTTDDCDDRVRATCTNTIGSFTCQCKDGYTGDGKTCVDIDECSLMTDDCDDRVRATCTNTVGSFTCVCRMGYTGDGKSCTNLNECVLETDDCDDPARAECTDTIGSFLCRCLVGYTGDGKSCVDIDECDLGTDNCNAQATCANTPGSFDCECLPGYTGDGVICDPINECTMGKHDCSVDAFCTDIPGSFICTCKEGYTGDGRTCIDIDECVETPRRCDDEVRATCTNTIGSFVCTCKVGYTGDGFVCTNIDECALNIDNCDDDARAICTDVPGSFNCACRDGFSGDGTTCVDIDECVLDIDGCHSMATCHNTIGSFFCRCRAGYTGDGFTCIDIDECDNETGISNCSVDAICTNFPGGFGCECRTGFVGDGFECFGNCSDDWDFIRDRWLNEDADWLNMTGNCDAISDSLKPPEVDTTKAPIVQWSDLIDQYLLEYQEWLKLVGGRIGGLPNSIDPNDFDGPEALWDEILRRGKLAEEEWKRAIADPNMMTVPEPVIEDCDDDRIEMWSKSVVKSSSAREEYERVFGLRCDA